MNADRVKRIIAEYLDIDETTLTDATTLRVDLGADSLDLVEITMALEDEFHIDMIPDDEAERVVTVADAVALVERHIKC